MNALTQALRLKRGAEKTLQGWGRKIGASLKERSIKGKKRIDEYRRTTGHYPG